MHYFYHNCCYYVTVSQWNTLCVSFEVQISNNENLIHMTPQKPDLLFWMKILEKYAKNITWLFFYAFKNQLSSLFLSNYTSPNEPGKLMMHYKVNHPHIILKAYLIFLSKYFVPLKEQLLMHIRWISSSYLKRVQVLCVNWQNVFFNWFLFISWLQCFLCMSKHNSYENAPIMLILFCYIRPLFHGSPVVKKF